jgi:Uma2 family endonuclease
MRHELIAGEHLVSPSPGRRHQAISMNLSRLLASFLHETRLGRVYAAPFDVVFTPHDVVEPDLLYVGAERHAVVGEANVQAAPDLAIEILSPSSRKVDELRKRDLYERQGVREYWIVDPVAETLKVFRRGADEAYGRPQLLTLHDQDVLATPLLPGLGLALAEIFAD